MVLLENTPDFEGRKNFKININKQENTIEVLAPLNQISKIWSKNKTKRHFNILQITDLHYFQLGITDRIEMKKIRQLCIDRDIDLVVCTGDMFGRRSLKRIKKIMKGFDSIVGEICPWTFAWGNHDCEVYRYGDYKSGDYFSVFDEAEAFFEKLPNMLYLKSRKFIENYNSQESDYAFKSSNDSASNNNTSDEKRSQLSLDAIDPEKFDSFYGGNFRILIKSIVADEKEENSEYVKKDNGDRDKTKSNINWNLFILNSRQAHHIPENALNWIEDTIKKEPFPSLIFYHVPNFEYVAIWEENRANGIKREKVCNELDRGYTHKRFKQIPEIKGCFVGHDHVNDYYGVEDGIIYSYGRKTGKNGYGSRKEEPKILKENVKAIKTGAKLIKIKLGEGDSDLKDSLWSFKTIFFDGNEDTEFFFN